MHKNNKKTVLKKISIKDIVLSKTNPRKIFDKEKIKELSESIKTHGVLQSILVRPKGKKYELVCGARRLKASKLAKLEEIPAQISDLTDDECFEKQIIENLEREDVHPLNEAIAFKKLVIKKYSPEDIATKISKSVSYVITRLQLNKLTKSWKDLFFNDETVNISHALIVSKLSESDQEIILEKGKNYNGSFKSVKEFKSLVENNITNSLDNASFDVKDSELIKKGVSCVDCLKRSGANSLLFADIENKDRCFDSPCFTLKTSIHTLNMVNSIIDKSEDVLFIQHSNSDINKGVLKLINAHKLSVLVQYVDFYTTSSKKGKKALWLNGKDAGKIITIEVNSKKEKNKNSEPTKKELIEKINLRAERSIELDAEKVHKKVVLSFDNAKEFKTIGKVKKKDIDIVLERFMILNSADWELKGKLFEDLKLDSFSNMNGTIEDKFKELLSLTDNQMIYAVRQISYSNYKSHLPTYDTGFLLRKLAEEFKEIPIASIEEEQEQVAEKRKARIKERIEKIQLSKKK